MHNLKPKSGIIEAAKGMHNLKPKSGIIEAAGDGAPASGCVSPSVTM